MALIVALEDRPHSPEVRRLKSWLDSKEFLDCAKTDELEFVDAPEPSIFDDAVSNAIEAKRDVFCLIIDIMLDDVRDIQIGAHKAIPTQNYDAGASFIREIARSGDEKFQYYDSIPILIWTAREWSKWLPQQYNAISSLKGFGPLGYAVKGDVDEKTRILKFFEEIVIYRSERSDAKGNSG